MGKLINLFEEPNFDCNYGNCNKCGCDDFKLLLTPEEEIGIFGFQCANCETVTMFDKDKDVVIFDLKDDNEKKDC
jgi:hypothetical protein